MVDMCTPRGFRTGVYAGPVIQTIAIVAIVAALFVAGAVTSGFVTTDELKSNPVGTAWKLVEPTVADLAAKWDAQFG
jgi:hypothetical protein